MEITVKELKGLGVSIAELNTFTKLFGESMVINEANVAKAIDNNLSIAWYMGRCGDIEVVKCLVENGADVNALDGNGSSALGYASWNGNIDVVKYLIKQEADVKAFGGDA